MMYKTTKLAFCIFIFSLLLSPVSAQDCSGYENKCSVANPLGVSETEAACVYPPTYLFPFNKEVDRHLQINIAGKVKKDGVLYNIAGVRLKSITGLPASLIVTLPSDTIWNNPFALQFGTCAWIHGLYNPPPGKYIVTYEFEVFGDTAKATTPPSGIPTDTVANEKPPFTIKVSMTIGDAEPCELTVAQDFHVVNPTCPGGYFESYINLSIGGYGTYEIIDLETVSTLGIIELNDDTLTYTYNWPDKRYLAIQGIDCDGFEVVWIEPEDPIVQLNWGQKPLELDIISSSPNCQSDGSFSIWVNAEIYDSNTGMRLSLHEAYARNNFLISVTDQDGNGIDITPYSSHSVFVSEYSISFSGFRPGGYLINCTLISSDYSCSLFESLSVNIESTYTNMVETYSSTQQSICQGTSVTLEAHLQDGFPSEYIQKVEWYDEAGTYLGEGNYFVTEPLFTSKKFHAKPNVNYYNYCTTGTVDPLIFQIDVTDIVVEVQQINPAPCLEGGQITLSPSGGQGNYTYTWTPNVSTTDQATDLPPGPYKVEVTDENGCMATVNVVLPAPSVSLSFAASEAILADKSTVCTGENVVLTAQVDNALLTTSYDWTDGTSTYSGASITVTPTANTTYTLTVTDPCMAGSLTATTTVATEEPILAATATQPTACDANDGSISLSISGCQRPPYAYTWTPNVSTGATATGLDEGTYTIEVTDKDGRVAQATVTLVANPTVITSVSVQQSATTVCTGDPVTLTATAVGARAQSIYDWTDGTNTYTGASITVNPTANTTYTLTLTDPCMVGSLTATATVETEVPIVSATATEPTACDANDGSISLSISGCQSPPYTYTWTPNVSTGATATGLDEGTYTIEVTDKDGRVAQATVTLVANPIVITSVSVQQSATTVCTGDAVTLNALGGRANSVYSWTDGSNTFTGASITVNPTANTTYTLTLTDPCMVGSLTATATVATEEPILAATATEPTACDANDGTITLSHSGCQRPPYTYTWTPNVSSGPTATGLDEGTYTIEVTDKDGRVAQTTVTLVANPIVITSVSVQQSATTVCTGDAVTLNALGGRANSVYSWTDGSNTFTGASITVNPTANTTYTLTLTDPCMVGSLTATATVETEVPIVSATATEPTACDANDGSISLSISGCQRPPYTYIWTPNVSTGATASGLDEGTYTIEVTDKDGRVAQTSATLTAPPIVMTGLSIQASATTVCSGNPVALAATATGARSQTTYTWTDGTGTYTGASITVTPTANTTYTVTVTDPCMVGNLMATQTIVVNSIPLVPTIQNSILCAGEPSLLRVMNPVAGIQYEWQMDGTDIGTGTTLNVGTVLANQSFRVRAINAAGCSSAYSPPQRYLIVSTPNFAVSSSPKQVEAGVTEVSFQHTAGSWATSFHWEFGDGGTTTLPNPVYVYQTPGLYVASLKITDINNCQMVKQVPILVSAPETIVKLPNAFSPNNDGVNDEYFVEAKGVSNFFLSIYDRNGNMVFSSNDPNVRWRGQHRSNNQMVTEGTYVIVVKFVDTAGQERVQTGTLNVIF